jgi:AcrR family transcriptional regulator
MAATGSRAGSREHRRARIEQTALELFREHGFDPVTVEDVCAAAAVAPATFYRYFGTKEEVVFAYRDDFRAAMNRAIDAGARVAENARLAVVLEAFAAFLESQQDLLALRDQIVVGHPRLMQRTLWVQREIEGVLAGGLAQVRGSPQPSAADLLEAGVGMLVLRLAVRSWRAEGHGSLRAATQAAFVRLRTWCADAPDGPVTQESRVQSDD